MDLKFAGEFVAEFHRIDEKGLRFRYPRKRIEVAPATAPRPPRLEIDFGALLSNLKLTHDVLDALDTLLIEQYAENKELGG